MELLGAKIYASLEEKDSKQCIQVYKKNGLYTVDLNGSIVSGLPKKDDVIAHLCQMVLFLIGLSKKKDEMEVEDEA